MTTPTEPSTALQAVQNVFQIVGGHHVFGNFPVKLVQAKKLLSLAQSEQAIH